MTRDVLEIDKETHHRSPMKKSAGILLNTCCKMSIMRSSIVLLKIGFRDSATGRQFAFKYAFVDASTEKLEILKNYGA